MDAAVHGDGKGGGARLFRWIMACPLQELESVKFSSDGWDALLGRGCFVLVAVLGTGNAREVRRWRQDCAR